MTPNDDAGSDPKPPTPPEDGATTSGNAPGGGEPAEAGGEREGAAARKERVLHTRVPAVLERELKRLAENLRVPVSNLIRTILEDAVDVADAAGDMVEERLKSAAKQLEQERERLKQRVRIDPLKDVFAFQSVTLAQKAACAKCGRDLAAGARAHLGLTDPDPTRQRPRIFVCDACLPQG